MKHQSRNQTPKLSYDRKDPTICELYYNINRAVILDWTTEYIKFLLNKLKIGRNWSSSCLGQINHVLTVGLGCLLSLLCVPDGLHLGQVCSVLIFCSLVCLPSLVTPPDAHQQVCPSAGLY